MTRADAIVVVLAVALVAGLYARFWPEGGAARTAEVYVDGRLVRKLALDAEARVQVAGPHGDSVLEVRPGAIRFVDSPCRGKFCVHSGWLEHGGQFTACVPNHVSVRVQGGPQRFDSVNF